ncbi:dTDP-4-dehydrorhamnose reductase [Acinetobacter nosocomialis]|uniref:dTDP-4-dehydrorhamnose reductase n=1 Tax=Acinetobacter nosocomialis TaxID=106654 RepID=UPI000DE6ACD2|nr:dTDP-4-dehydrorhamnose reductase [Acinetobacter nosocomialis]SSR40248.1 dTDP-4-dehydrorhamnose reductase (dTDP-4-keto-L-rhamnose reductase) (dTDP-6-deoxy-L-mannose dehydrogenase) (dTDP-L-rhamnose synthetase) [Acinetobacter baumannii]MBO8210395.1 dTDP-4-dehydrorhamnose reductase [Acinetobacter nosocomialis]MBO8226771.1 dTDP-4-dehydrorhamnose reductase [Acinetobacter nosocomialis]MBO8252252.1 dTDP-4-dehydrorhamnose reductase [Acinetobacter nosocomialis]MBR7691039.1 dTDP-4-dehydrorhamnose redu
MKILLLGKNGQVGWELQRALQPLGEVIPLDRSTSVDGFSGDLANFDQIKQAIEKIQPNIIVNAAAYTAVDKAESDQEMADLINHLAVKNLAKLCQIHHILLIHYSTDYVFNGEGTKAWSESDLTDPVNSYGNTKRLGEIALEQSGCAFINFRTCWVYGSHGNNFIKTMLKLASNREELSIIHDQIGAPTGAALIADVTAQALKYYSLMGAQQQKDLLGHYHLAAAGECSWFDYAQFVFELAKQKGQSLAIQKVNAIETTAYPTPAKRPLNSRLNTNKLQANFKIHLPNWKLGVAQVLEEII